MYTARWTSGISEEVYDMEIDGKGTGVGKSSLANLLLGRDRSFNGSVFKDGCFRVSPDISGITKKTSPDSGHWLCLENNPEVTIIDTPGFGSVVADDR